MTNQRTWTDDEKADLRRASADGLSLAAMGRMLGRSKAAVKRMRKTLDLPSRPCPIMREKPPAVLQRGRSVTLPALASLS